MKMRTQIVASIAILMVPLFSVIVAPRDAYALEGAWGNIGSSLGDRYFTDIAVSGDGRYLAVTEWVGSVYTSTDYGETWTERSSIGSDSWDGVTISNDGQTIAVVDKPGKVHISTDNGETWTESTSLDMSYWGWIDASSDGSTILIGADASGSPGGIALSKDTGVTWETLNTGDYNYVAVSGDGTTLAYNDQSEGGIMLSTDSGENWELARSTVANIGGLDISTDGEKMVVIEGDEAKLADVDVLSWSTSTVTDPVFDVAMDSTGQNLVAGASSGYGIYSSDDSGVSWEPGQMTSSLDLRAVAITDNGQRAFAVGNNRIWVNNEAKGSDDINGDLIPDVAQPNIGGYVSGYSGKLIGIDVGEDCELTVDDSVDEDFLGVNDVAYEFESGLFEYEAECAIGATTTITLYYYDTDMTNKSVRKFMPRINGYVNLGSEHNTIIEERVINGSSVVVASFDITDGGELDDDQLVDGMIVDPVGLAEEILAAPNTGLAPTY